MEKKRVYLSEAAERSLIEYVKSIGCEPIFVPNHTGGTIGTHPDLYMCHLGNLLFHGDINNVGTDYPEDAVYNAASTGKFFIHNTKITHPDLLAAAKDSGLEIIHVNQAYGKCNCCLVDEDSIITSDAGIAKACKDKLQVCLIKPGHIALENYKYGFIGGASGRIDNEIIFNGNLPDHPDYERIKTFIECRGLKVTYFENYPLTDIGSIIAE